MLKKFGINTTHSKKAGPPVKDAIKSGHKKVITCSCGARLEKSCANEYMCEISKVSCPRCGKKVG